MWKKYKSQQRDRLFSLQLGGAVVGENIYTSTAFSRVKLLKNSTDGGEGCCGGSTVDSHEWSSFSSTRPLTGASSADSIRTPSWSVIRVI